MKPTTTRTFQATCYAIDCGVIRARSIYILTITGMTLDAVCLLDGEACTVERAQSIRAWAKETGTWEQIGETLQAHVPVGKKVACNFHKDMTRLGYANRAHYEIASSKLGREVVSLAALTLEELTLVWAHACLVRGYSTPLIRLYTGEVAA